MLDGTLIATVAGLAALDSLNPATIAGVALILLAPVRRPAATALAYVLGAYVVVLGVGTGLFVGSAELGETVGNGATWVRRGALVLAAVLVGAAGLRRLRPRLRPAVTLPRWFGPWTAAPLGVAATAADLPNAFPYLVAIERLNAAQVPTSTGVVVLALYALVYCLPCLLLLGVGLAWRGHVGQRLQRVYARVGAERQQPRSVPVAAGLLAVSGVLVLLALTL